MGLWRCGVHAVVQAPHGLHRYIRWQEAKARCCGCSSVQDCMSINQGHAPSDPTPHSCPQARSPCYVATSPCSWVSCSLVVWKALSRAAQLLRPRSRGWAAVLQPPGRSGTPAPDAQNPALQHEQRISEHRIRKPSGHAGLGIVRPAPSLTREQTKRISSLSPLPECRRSEPLPEAAVAAPLAQAGQLAQQGSCRAAGSAKCRST